MRTRRYLAHAVALAAAALFTPVPAYAQDAEAELFASDNMSHIANLPYELAYPDVEELPYGTDIEFAQLEVPVDGAGADVIRVAGDHRIATAAAISAQTLTSADTVVVATADEYADALAGAPLAASLDAPLLLSAADELSEATAAEIERLGATEAVLLGQTTALDEDIADALTDAGLSVRRIGGDNRFETAAAILEELPASAEVFLVEGEHADAARGWPDALSTSALAASSGSAILLTNAAFLPDATAAALRPETQVTIVGGTASVSEAVADEVDETAASVDRIAGANRYETSALVASEALARGLTPAVTWLATGEDFADGLTAGTAAAAANGLLLLVDPESLDVSAASRDLLTAHAAQVSTAFIAGGTAAISTAVEAEVAALLLAAGGATELREFAIAGSEFNGMQIVDITDPEQPEIVSVYDCGILQGDVQVFRQGDRTFATYTSEDTSSTVVESRCIRELTPEATAEDKSPAYGAFVVEITDPYNPTSRAHIPVIEGSHNGTVHPSGLYYYNSNSSLIVNPVLSPSETTYIEYYDISDLDNITRIGELPLPIRPGLGTESHDISFSADGTRAYSAALSNTVIIDTTDPAAPGVISNFEDPAINVEHQAEVIDVVTSEGEARRLLIVQDELAGAAGNGFCPGGGVHIWDITGDNELSPQSHKVGVFYIDEFRPAGSGSGQGESITCTAHVFRLYPEHGLMTIAWYNAGVWVLDISGLADGATSPTSMPIEALGFAYFSNSDTWSFKTNLIEEDGSFYGYGNDIVRGFDVYRFDATVEAAVDPGTFMTPAEALAFEQRRQAGLDTSIQLTRCLLGATR